MDNTKLIYQWKNWEILLKEDIKNDTIWANLNQISELFSRDKSVISRHIKNIFNTWELEQNWVVAKIATTASDWKTYQVEYFNLDMIISIWYRVDSKQATELFAQEKNSKSLEWILWNVFQSFNWNDLYPTLEEKA